MKDKKAVIFGGSFDPIHFGHIDIVNNLARVFDTVYVMPTATSPFKTDNTDGALRLKLCKTAFKGVGIKVSDYEIKKGGVSYSVNTAKAYAKKCDKLFWAIGSEEVARLEFWHDIETLAKLVTFYVIERPGFPLEAERIKELKSEGIIVKRAPFNGVDVSSAQVKLDIAFDKDNRFVPDRLFKTEKLNFNTYGKYVAALYKYNLPQGRIEHTYRVAEAGIRLAKRYGVSVNDTIIACILHDVAKNYTDPEIAAKAAEKSLPKSCVHGVGSAIVCRREFNLSDEIVRAIEIHTTGDENMSLLDKIVYLADKIERGRTFDAREYLEFLAFIDIDLAMGYQLKRTKEMNKDEYCELGDKALEWCELLNEGKVLPEMPARKFVIDTPKVEEKKPKTLNFKQKVKVIAKCLSDKKGMDIDIIDVSNKSALCDYFIIATATSTTHVKALYEAVDEKLSKEYGEEPLRRDIDSTWIAVDYGDVIVHIFKADAREFYNIERLWDDGENITRYED